MLKQLDVGQFGWSSHLKGEFSGQKVQQPRQTLARAVKVADPNITWNITVSKNSGNLHGNKS